MTYDRRHGFRRHRAGVMSVCGTKQQAGTEKKCRIFKAASLKSCTRKVCYIETINANSVRIPRNLSRIAFQRRNRSYSMGTGRSEMCPLAARHTIVISNGDRQRRKQVHAKTVNDCRCSLEAGNFGVPGIRVACSCHLPLGAHEVSEPPRSRSTLQWSPYSQKEYSSRKICSGIRPEVRGRQHTWDSRASLHAKTTPYGP